LIRASIGGLPGEASEEIVNRGTGEMFEPDRKGSRFKSQGHQAEERYRVLSGISISFKAIKFIILPLILILSVLGCSDRERNNPFDPQNPDAEQMNIGFNALAGNKKVLLHWDSLKFVDLKGIQVIRLSEDSPDTAILNESLLPPEVIEFMDDSVENGVTYAYYLRLVLKDSPELHETKSDLATPGWVFGWMEIENGTNIALMTPDFRDELFVLDAPFYSIQDIQFHPSNSKVWVLDGYTGKIASFTDSGEWLDEVSGLENVGAFRFNNTDQSVWIAVKSLNGLLYHFSTRGELIEAYNTNLTPTSISVEYPTGDVWVGSSDPQIVKIHNKEVIQLAHSDFAVPELVAAGEAYKSSVWVLDTGSRTLFHFTNQALDWSLKVFKEPVDLVVNSDGDLCWIADPGADFLYQIDQKGNISNKLGGLGRPDYLVYNGHDNTVYVTGTSGKISKLAVEGQIIWQVENQHQPGRIALQIKQLY